jgi:putative hydroxymethylpyrimidine transport system permease protein
VRGARYTVAALASVGIVWQLAVMLTGVPRYILPSLNDVLVAFADNWQLIGEHLLVTLTEVVLGLVIGTCLGFVTALQLEMSTSARLFLRPILIFSQAIPVFALAPLLTLWLGYGMISKVVMAILIIYFPVTSSFYDGLLTTPKPLLDLAATMRTTKWRQLFLIKVPAAAPSLFSGIRLAAVYAPIGATIGEWVGSSQGLGYLMLLASGRVKIDLMFASLLTLGVMSMGLYAIITLLLSRLSRYHN